MTDLAPLLPTEGAALVVLARRTLRSHLLGVPPIDAGADAFLDRRAGAFVTLYKGVDLRGCIGRIDASRELRAVVPAMAIAAATQDPRFPPVRPDELAAIRVEVSVLGPVRPCAAADVVVGRDGLVVSRSGYRGLLLPEVAAARGWDVATFVAATCQKAGLSPDAVQRGARLERFETWHFGE